jgi:hypothetical protein
VKTPEEMLAGTTEKTWTMTNLIRFDGKDVTSEYKSFSFKFKRDGAFQYTRQLVGSSEPSKTDGTWSIEDKTTLILTLSGSPNKETIIELTDTSLILKKSDSNGKTTLKPQ